MQLQHEIGAVATAAQCLHLSRSGKRCSHAALENGFCEGHGPDAVWRFNIAARRRIFAVLIGAAILWPILAELWRALRH